MEQVEHFIQDACEHLAVARMQEHAEKLGLSKLKYSLELRKAFICEVKNNNIKPSDFARFPEYELNIEKHIPKFVERIAAFSKGRDLIFRCNEKEKRNEGRKGDFDIEIDRKTLLSVSLKNYRNSVSRPQVSSGTFNSFALSFLFEKARGVGMLIDPRDHSVFKGSTKSTRDAVLSATGKSKFISPLHKLDDLNTQIKETFVKSNDFEFLDEVKFDSMRKYVGNSGARLVLEILNKLDPREVRNQIISRIGFDGKEDQLLFDPIRYSDSITVPKFQRLIKGVRETADMTFKVQGQSIVFNFVIEKSPVLKINIPFTINKNGAWISEEYAGTRFHKKEGIRLAANQRRPKKSRELATSVNTYVDFEAAGIFLIT